MTTENGVLDLPFAAAEDLSSDQFKFVVLTTAGTVRRPDSEAESALGILQNAPGSGEAAAVRLLGTSKLRAGAALTVGLFVMPEYVSAADAGKGKTSASTPAYTRAQVMVAAGAEDDLAQVLLTSPFPAAFNTTITDPGTAGAIPVAGNGVCAMTSAGAETRTIAAPAFLGQTVSLIDNVHVGNIVVTAATTVNQTGNNTLTFGAAADACTLTAMMVAGALVWRISFNDGVALSTV